MKYTPETIEKITNAIKRLKGRVNSCKEADIHYDTFCEWMKKTEFSEAIKKAEKEAKDKGKEIAIMSIFKAMPNQWQAAAWWLERNYPEEYRNRTETDLTSGGEKLSIFDEKQLEKIARRILNDNSPSKEKPN